ncbi:MAG: hypothetical protein ACM3S2_20790 [Ignavibacteriales bacterium]
MDFVTINALADKKQILVIKDIIDKLSERLPNLIVTSFKLGKIGENTMVSFKVEKSCYKILVEKLTFNNIRIVMPDENTKEVVDTAKNQARSIPLVMGKPRGGVNKSSQDEQKKTLEEYIRDGDYREVIRISRTVTEEKDIIEKAKNSIADTISRAINNAYNEALTKKYDIAVNLEKLIKIAADSNIKMLQRMDLLKDAGLKAITICAGNKDYVGDLISLANNNALHNLVNIKAAVKFAEVVLPNKDIYRDDLNMAIKNMNTRWLSIISAGFTNELNAEEMKLFEKLIQYIQNHRAGKP